MILTSAFLKTSLYDYLAIMPKLRSTYETLTSLRRCLNYASILAHVARRVDSTSS